jgi:hypothetical protein
LIRAEVPPANAGRLKQALAPPVLADVTNRPIVRLPGSLVELLQHAHDRGDAHHEGCDFHVSPPQHRAPMAQSGF